MLVGNRPPMVRAATVSDTPPPHPLRSLPAAPTPIQTSTKPCAAKPYFWSIEDSVMQVYHSVWISTRLQRNKDILEVISQRFLCLTVKSSTLFLFIINQYILYKKGQRGSEIKPLQM